MKNKAIWIGITIGIISSLYFVYRAINLYSFNLGKPISYTFVNHPFAVIFPIILSMAFWIFIVYLTENIIKAKNIIVWWAFLGGLIGFFYAILFIELDLAGGLIQISWLILFGIIIGIIISFIIKKLRKNGERWKLKNGGIN